MKHRISIIVSDFNGNITSKMLAYAEKTAKKLGLDITSVVHVPGTFEIPLALKHVLSKKNIDGAVVLGAVKQGDTGHDVVVAENCARQIMKLSLKHSTPIGLGVIGPKATIKTAEERAEEYSVRAVETVSKMINVMRQ